MDTRKFLLAMNELDDRYILKADAYGLARAKRQSRWSRISAWATPLAACLCIFAVFWTLRSLGLLSDPPAQGGAGSSGDSPAVVYEDQSPASEITAVTEVPLEDLPQLTFPEKDSSEYTGTLIGCGPLPEDGMELHDSEIASIFGGEVVPSWEGLLLSGAYAGYFSHGTAYFNEDGQTESVELTVKKNVELGGSRGITIHINYPVGEWLTEPTCTCDVWGTEVTTAAQYYDANEKLSTPGGAAYQVSFAVDSENGENLNVIAKCDISYSSLSNYTDDEAKELLTRFASQCLRPGNTFQISQLSEALQAAEEEKMQKAMEESEAKKTELIQRQMESDEKQEQNKAEAEEKLREEMEAALAEMEAKLEAEMEKLRSQMEGAAALASPQPADE